MDQLMGWIDYLRQDPKLAAAAVAGVAVFLYLLFRKPKTVRDANAQLRKMRGEKAGYYDQMRPPH